LPYSYEALEPHIDRQTMLLHHTSDVQIYTDFMNLAINEMQDSDEGMEEFDARTTLDDLLRRIAREDAGLCERSKIWKNDEIRTTFRNNAGGYVNHILYFHNLSPDKPKLIQDAPLHEAIQKRFGSIKEFEHQFKHASKTVFGSGWVWLVYLPHEDRLEITTTANQDIAEFNPKMTGTDCVPLLGLDCWEHAYFVVYHSDRLAYVNHWWRCINWVDVDRRYTHGRMLKEQKSQMETRQKQSTQQQGGQKQMQEGEQKEPQQTAYKPQVQVREQPAM
jgi:Fe-Mn family superoxide dismutase